MSDEKEPESKSSQSPEVKTASAESKQSSRKKDTGQKRKKSTAKGKRGRSSSQRSAYPRHAIDTCLRIPKAILEQNAGKACTESEAAKFTGIAMGGAFRLEVSSCIKFALLERPSPGRIQPTELAKGIIRPHEPDQAVKGLRQGVINAPSIAEVYKHYRGENLPDEPFFTNALTDNFSIPEDKVPEFTQIFKASLKAAKLMEEHDGKTRVLDVTEEIPTQSGGKERRVVPGKDAPVGSGDTCFVMMPFGGPLGEYYTKIYEPAIRKAGLTPIRADNEIFATGRIIDQIWRGISGSKVLLAELTDRNPNVFYELGLAHAAGKPVVLVSSNQNDVPFDLQHIRVIYYDMHDPFWGAKLIDKVAENVLSALRNPAEAKFERAVEGTVK